MNLHWSLSYPVYTSTHPHFLFLLPIAPCTFFPLPLLPFPLPPSCKSPTQSFPLPHPARCWVMQQWKGLFLTFKKFIFCWKSRQLRHSVSSANASLNLSVECSGLSGLHGWTTRGSQPGSVQRTAGCVAGVVPRLRPHRAPGPHADAQSPSPVSLEWANTPAVIQMF